MLSQVSLRAVAGFGPETHQANDVGCEKFFLERCQWSTRSQYFSQPLQIRHCKRELGEGVKRWLPDGEHR